MYMAFVIHENDEDRVSFYTRTDEGKVYVSMEYIQRGDSNTLNYFINQYMFPKKQMVDLSQNKVIERDN
ncbi:MAG: hypothetical protein CXT73_05110 [Methanobacteriota archaeon]|nr:MAG: hypothetical protein CXT73_05110 [Euryarchaeota archaeon]